MIRKALPTLALLLAALFALATPGQAVSRLHRHGHSGHRHSGRPHHRRSSFSGRDRDDFRDVFSRHKSAFSVHYTPPNAIGPTGHVSPGQPPQSVVRGQKMDIVVSPVSLENAQDRVAVTVSYLYQLTNSTHWTQGILGTTTFPSPHPRLLYQLTTGGTTSGKWDKLIIVFDETEKYLGTVSRYVTAEAVDFDQNLPRPGMGGGDDYDELRERDLDRHRHRHRRSHHRRHRHHHPLMGHKSHYTPPNSR